MTSSLVGQQAVKGMKRWGQRKECERLISYYLCRRTTNIKESRMPTCYSQYQKLLPPKYMISLKNQDKRNDTLRIPLKHYQSRCYKMDSNTLCALIDNFIPVSLYTYIYNDTYIYHSLFIRQLIIQSKNDYFGTSRYIYL